MELAAAVESARLAVVRAIVVTMAGQVLALKLLMICNLKITVMPSVSSSASSYLRALML